MELVSCDLLREGAPIEPVPPVTHWKPDAVVREAVPAVFAVHVVQSARASSGLAGCWLQAYGCCQYASALLEEQHKSFEK